MNDNDRYNSERLSADGFDWKDQLRKQVDASRERHSVGPHQFNIRDNYSRSYINQMKNRGGSIGSGILNKTNYSSLHQVKPRLTEISESVVNLKRSGIVKLYKKSTPGRNSHREHSYSRPTESLKNRQRQLGTELSLSNSTLEMADASKRAADTSRVAKSTENLHRPSLRVTTEIDKENFPMDANKEIQDIKNCLENLKVVQNSLKDKSKPPLGKPAHNPVLRLKKKETGRDSSLNSSRLHDSVDIRPPTRESSIDSINKVDRYEYLSYVAYGSHSDVGISRHYNEDRITTVERIAKRSMPHRADCVFGVFDGHGGNACADYLMHNLHELLARSSYLATDKIKALEDAFSSAEVGFCREAKEKKDFSGSCAIVALIDTKQLIIANVGDSRAILSTKKGIIQLSYDHKPEVCTERERILNNGGKVYRMRSESFIDTVDRLGTTQTTKNETQVGPYRVEPGGLSVSRTIGDIRAKDVVYNGNPKCVIATPEIRQMALSQNDEFLVLGCDGIFDVLSNEEVVKVARATLRSCHYKTMNEAKACEKACFDIIEAAKQKKSRDNLTAVLVMFRDLFYFK